MLGNIPTRVNLDAATFDDRWDTPEPTGFGFIDDFKSSLLALYVHTLQTEADPAYGQYLKLVLAPLRTVPVGLRTFLHAQQHEIPVEFRKYNLFYWKTELVEAHHKDLFIPGSRWDESKQQWEDTDLPLEGEGWGPKHAALLYLGR